MENEWDANSDDELNEPVAAQIHRERTPSRQLDALHLNRNTTANNKPSSLSNTQPVKRQPSGFWGYFASPKSGNGSTPLSSTTDTVRKTSITHRPAMPSIDTSASWIHVPQATEEKVIKLPQKMEETDMATAVKADALEILKDPVYSIARLRVGDDGSFYDAGPSAQPLNVPPTPAFRNGSSYLSISPQSASSEASTSKLPDSTKEPSLESNNAAQEPESAQEQSIQRDKRRKEKFLDCLCKETVDLGALRKLAWKGIPNELRPMVWQLLLAYLPAPSSRRVSTLARKRQEYVDASHQAFSRGLSHLDQSIWHQIHIDVPRTNPGIPLWAFEATQRSLERILYVWAIRHPVSGYVQGINDLVTPLFEVFLSSYIEADPETFNVEFLPDGVLEAIEADSFWCLSKLLDGIQDNYLHGQPGIQRQVSRLKFLCERIDAPLATHFSNQNIEFIQFAFKWIHLLLLRVLPVDAVVRMWDTYMSEGTNAFSDYHTYVCLAFLLRHSAVLREMDFQAMMLFFQSPVEHQNWNLADTEVLLSEGFLWFV